MMGCDLCPCKLLENLLTFLDSCDLIWLTLMSLLEKKLFGHCDSNKAWLNCACSFCGLVGLLIWRLGQKVDH